jgi:hypothetical protein
MFLIQVKHAIYDQAIYVNNYHKNILKDQYGKCQELESEILFFLPR